MPKGFDTCKANGGKIRTEQVGVTKYKHVCYINGKKYPGYIKTKKKK